MYNHQDSIWKERIRSVRENQYLMFADIEKLFLKPTNLLILIGKSMIIIQLFLEL